MSPVVRRIVYATLYEALGIVFASLGLSLLSAAPLGHTGPLATACSLVALGWNLVFNTVFEAWEARQSVRGRGFRRRAAHALSFEFGLTILLVPLVAWWLDVTLLEAFVYDLALIVFFVVYTFVFNLTFDRLFGLPDSARG